MLSPSLTPQLRQAVLEWLHENSSPPRVRHILGVEQTARELAQSHHLDGDQAAWAGLLHDLAKYFPPERLLAWARQEGLPLDPITRAEPHLIHADVSALVARDHFGVDDAEILNAIGNHTLGQPEMDDLSCVLFVADALEPSRGNSPELIRLRQLAHNDLYLCVARVCDYGLQYLLNRDQLIHPRSILTRNAFLRRVRPIHPPIHPIDLHHHPTLTGPLASSSPD